MDALSVQLLQHAHALRKRGYTPAQIALLLSMDVGEVRLLVFKASQLAKIDLAAKKATAIETKRYKAVNRPYARTLMKNLRREMMGTHRRGRKFRFQGWNANDSREIWELLLQTKYGSVEKRKIIYSNFAITPVDQERVEILMSQQQDET